MSTPPLLAILLVTSSSLSSSSKHLLFHYPPHPQPHSSSNDDEEIPDDSSSDQSSDSGSTSSSSSSTSSSPSLSSLHSSKLSRLTTENNHYTIDEDEDHHDDEFERDEDDDRTGTSPPAWRRKQHTTEWENTLFGLTKRDLADILIPKAALCNRKFELGVDDLVFLGHPVHIPKPNPSETTAKGGGSSLATSPSDSINDEADTDQIVRKVGLSKFHVVFVMNPSWRLDYHDQVQKMYTEIISKFVEACEKEQQERSYISLEAFKIYRTMRDAEDKELPMSMVWEELITKSNLAHAICTLYNSIIHNKVAFVDLNNRIELPFHIKQISQISSLPEVGTSPFNERTIPLLSTAHGFGTSQDEADQVLAPKYTLLFMDEPDEILKKVPSRPPIRRQNWEKFLTLKPTITFKRLSREQKLPLSLVMSMARELIDLDIARAIPPLSNRGIYIVSPLAPIHSLSSQSRTFKSRFPPPTPPLPTLLSHISSSDPRPWSHYLSTYRLPATLLPYLMRQGWLTQLRQFYFIRIPRAVKAACSSGLAEVGEDEILVDPFRASREEVRWIKGVAEGLGGTEGRMFERLGKYFDGKSAKEKILRREQVERGELEGMLAAVRKVGGLVVAEHW